MKRLTIFISATVLLYLLTGCGESKTKTYDLYKKMTGAVASVKSIDMDISTVIDVAIGEEENAVAYSYGNIKKIFNGDTDIDIEINLNMRIGEGTTVNTTNYYHDGINYYNVSGGKYKTSVSAEDALQKLPGITHTDLLDFPEDAIKDFKISNHDGGKKVELTLYGNDVTSLLEKNKDAEDLTIGDVMCEFVIDKNNMLKSYRMIYETGMTVRIEEVNTMKTKSDISITVNSYDDVTIDFPDDLDDYIYDGY